MTSELPRFWSLFLSCQQQKNIKKGAAVTSLSPSYSVTTLVKMGHSSSMPKIYYGNPGVPSPFPPY